MNNILNTDLFVPDIPEVDFPKTRFGYQKASCELIRHEFEFVILSESSGRCRVLVERSVHEGMSVFMSQRKDLTFDSICCVHENAGPVFRGESGESVDIIVFHGMTENFDTTIIEEPEKRFSMGSSCPSPSLSRSEWATCIEN